MLGVIIFHDIMYIKRLLSYNFFIFILCLYKDQRIIKELTDFCRSLKITSLNYSVIKTTLHFLKAMLDFNIIFPFYIKIVLISHQPYPLHFAFFSIIATQQITTLIIYLFQ